AVCSRLESKGFVIDGNSILKTVCAVRGTSVKRKSILALRELPPDDLRIQLVQSRRALEKAIDFLRTEVGVISSDFLPYDAQLTLLGKLMELQQQGGLSPEQRMAIRSWFWLASFHERYRGAAETVLDGDAERFEVFSREGGPLLSMRKVEFHDLK